MSKTLKTLLGAGAIVVIIGVLVVTGSYVTSKYDKHNTLSLFRTSGSSRGQIADNEEFVPPYSVSTAEPTMASKDRSGGDTRSNSRNLMVNKPGTDGTQGEASRLIIKTGNISVVVKDVAQSIKVVSNFAEKVGGFVVSSNIYKSGTTPYGVVTIRIPSTVFDQGVKETKGLGEVVSEDVRGQDVTEEYVDLDSQLKNLRSAEEQFLNIMKRAEKIEDILAVQNQLTQVRGQIESIQGRMKYLKQSSDLSSLTVNFSTDPSVLPVVNQDANTWKPLVVIKDALRSLLEVGKSLVNVLIWIIIFIPVWGVGILIIWLIYRRTSRAVVGNKNNK